MTLAIDIVGHFGTTFSYATVASRVARALLDLGALGGVTNLDPEWHPAHESLRAFSGVGAHSHVFVVTLPRHYLDVYPGLYGRERSAVFLSPNTDALGREYAATTALFGLAVAPSAWCAEVTERALREHEADTEVVCAPLGVDEVLLDTRAARIARLRERSGEEPVVVHMSTDQAWPGRKGTEELLYAWSALADAGAPGRLVVHVPPAIWQPAEFLVRDRDLDGSVEIRVGGTHGSQEGDLLALFDEADLMVAPSRCEGFGIMLAGAVVGGVPLLCPYETGQRDFLGLLPGWLGLPAGEPAELVGEEGLAPSINVRVLAEHLRVALHPEVRRALTEDGLGRVDFERHTWRGAAPQFALRLVEWMNRED